jgi:hypothetical protein
MKITRRMIGRLALGGYGSVTTRHPSERHDVRTVVRWATPSGMAVVEHLREGRLDYELGTCNEQRRPPVPVTAIRLFDRPEIDGLLYGWAANPNGANDGWRGLAYGLREFAPGSPGSPGLPPLSVLATSPGEAGTAT